MRALVIGLVLFVTGGFFCATRIAAQTDPCLRRVVPVNVVGSHGAIFSDLTIDNFEASLHHKPVKIVSVTRDDAPRRIVVALDESGSMHQNWNDSVQVARFLLASMRNDDWMGIVTFSDKIHDDVPLTQERGSLNVELERLRASPEVKPKGGTAIWDTLVVISAQFGAPRMGDSIFLVSDGGDNLSDVSESKAEKLLMERGIRLFALLPKAERGGPSPQESGRAASLTEPVVNTGGYGLNLLYFPPKTKGDAAVKSDSVETALRMEIRQIQTFERVEIELPERIQKPQEWKLKAKGLSDAPTFVAYPHTLAACANP
jgi:hypothetical protein